METLSYGLSMDDNNGTFTYNNSSSINGSSGGSAWIPLNSTTLSFGANSSSSSTGTGTGTDEATDATTFLSCFGWLILLLYCACSSQRQNRPSREHWRGQQIHESAERIWQRRDFDLEKQEQSPEQRQQLFDQGLYTQQIQAYDPQTGQWTLGDVKLISSATSPTSTDTTSPTEISPADTSPADTPSPTSTNSNSQNQQLLLQEQEQEDDLGIINYEDEDEDDMCAICLEPFCVGDIVSWSRTTGTDSSCQQQQQQQQQHCPHVFHSDCIQPWLLDKRQDECPSCRSTLLNNDLLMTVAPNNKDDNADDAENQNPSLMPRDEERGSMAMMGKDEDEGEHHQSQQQEESLFVIVHGLIARATRRASLSTRRYSLIGTKDSMDDSYSYKDDDDDDDDPSSSSFGPEDLLAIPSPLRRVASHGTVMHQQQQQQQQHQDRSASFSSSLSGSFRNLFLKQQPLLPTGAASQSKSKASPLAQPISFRRTQSETSTTPVRRNINHNIHNNHSNNHNTTLLRRRSSARRSAAVELFPSAAPEDPSENSSSSILEEYHADEDGCDDDDYDDDDDDDYDEEECIIIQ